MKRLRKPFNECTMDDLYRRAEMEECGSCRICKQEPHYMDTLEGCCLLRSQKMNPARRELFKHEYLKLCEEHGLCMEVYWPHHGEMFVDEFTEEHKKKISCDLMYEDDTEELEDE